MRNKLNSIPTPLQAQILLQSALAALSLAAGITLLAIFRPVVALPFFFLAVLAAVNAIRVYRAAVSGQYVTVTGTILKVERTAFLRRAKAFVMEADGKAVRVMLRSRRNQLKEAEAVTVYIHDSTPIHEWKGLHLLGAYIALEK